MSVTERMVEMTFSVTVKAELADRLVKLARDRDQPPAALVADVMERVIIDDLFAAVLDD